MTYTNNNINRPKIILAIHNLPLNFTKADAINVNHIRLFYDTKRVFFGYFEFI